MHINIFKAFHDKGKFRGLCFVEIIQLEKFYADYIIVFG